MKYKFKHRKVIDYSYICLIPDDDLFKFIKEKHPYELIPNVKIKTYRQRAEEYCTQVLLENFTLKINKEAIKNIFEKDLLKVREL